MEEHQDNLPGYPQSEADMVSEALRRPLAEKIQSAIGLLQLYEQKALELSPDGYWLAYSGGKDSECILELARMAGVKHRPVYNVTTIDPPELVRFIKREHPEVRFNRHRREHMLNRMVNRPGTPPTRSVAWCCDEYKHNSGRGTLRIIGVRADESPSREKLWRAVLPDKTGGGAILCPIVYWTTKDVWAFHGQRNLPHCSLYDEGFDRLGCVGCPKAGPKMQAKEFARWPRYAAMWHRAVMRNWEKYHDLPRNDGKPRYQAGFEDGEAFWQWWISGKRQGPRQACQGEFLFANAENRAPGVDTEQGA